MIPRLYARVVAPHLSLTIPGDPVGKGRPIFSTRNGRVTARTPGKTAAWERFAAAAFFMRRGGQTITGPCRLHVVAVGKRPKRLMGKDDPQGRVWRTTKPDGDNVLKAVADALVLGEVIRDDVLLVEMTVLSVYAAKGEQACVEVELTKEEGGAP